MKRPDGCVVSPDGSAEIKAGKKPRGLLFSREGDRLYVSNGGGDYVSIVDPTKNIAFGKTPAGRDPRAMILTPDGKYLVISNVS